MKNRTIRALMAAFGLFITGCTSATHLTDNKSAWFNHREVLFSKVIYCDVTSDGKPFCIEPNMISDKVDHNTRAYNIRTEDTKRSFPLSGGR